MRTESLSLGPEEAGTLSILINIATNAIVADMEFIREQLSLPPEERSKEFTEPIKDIPGHLEMNAKILDKAQELAIEVEEIMELLKSDNPIASKIIMPKPNFTSSKTPEIKF